MPAVNQRIFFDNLAEEWDKIVAHRPDKLEFIAGVLELAPGQRVLDIGCGTGVMIPYLLRAVTPGGGVDALDLSPRMVEVARRKFPETEHPGLRYFVSDIGGFNLGADYDVILCYSSFPHFSEDPGIIAHLARGLRFGGRLVVAHSEARTKINREHEEREGYLPPLEELARAMREAGLHLGMTLDTDEMFLLTGYRH
ncbi:MAG: methyltransferase domain-containing protein [Candidatus Coatesbacteria bacterium]|nr:methyltransferase domain-containing protein [Candidatus Coatesbacteria bacterium]